MTNDEVVRTQEIIEARECIHTLKNICEKYEHCSECSIEEICRDNFVYENKPVMWKE